MEGFSNWDREEPFDPFTVMLFKGLQVVAFMFFLAYLAINTDAEAPMMTKATYAVVGDMHEVVPAINEELRRRRG